MLHFRNTYKNCKMIWVYSIFAVLSLMIAIDSLLFTFMPQFKVVSIVVCIIFTISFIINIFLFIMKNNNYKLKYFFKIGEFYKEFQKFKKLCQGNKAHIKEIGKQQKDYFLQYGKCIFTEQLSQPVKNQWNDWIEEAADFNYLYSGYMDKLSYLTYVLYHSCSSGGGLEEFFRFVDGEPFHNHEIIDIVTKSEFFNNDFKNFLVNIIEEYNKEKQDELFERYELEDNKTFFAFEEEIYNYANWLAHNRMLLLNCVGVVLHGNVNYDIYRLFLSKDYKKVVYIYNPDKIGNECVRVCHKVWNHSDECWELLNEGESSIYDSIDEAFNDIKYTLKDYIELEI